MTFSTRQIGKTNLSIPTLGFGGAPLGGLLDAVDAVDSMATLRAATQAGMRYVDTAPFYGFGLSERRVGDVIRGGSYVLSTKVGRLLVPGAAENPAAMGWPEALPFHPVYDYSYDGIMRSFEQSLQRLGLDRIDILYVHDIGEVTHGAQNAPHFKALAESGYRALDSLRQSGQISAIGLGVNETAVCMEALEIGDWDAFLLAGRYTLLEQHALTDLLPACAARDVSIVVGGPYNSGILVGGDTWNYGAAPQEVVERVQQLKATCRDFDVALPAAALQFPMGHPSVASVIPGLRTPEELRQTLDWANAVIPAAFWDQLKDQDLLHPEAPVPAARPFSVA
ncbi:MAG: aldo/keto reductase [Thalassovita sp.]